MFNVYRPTAGTSTISLVSTNGVDGVSDQTLLLNILIELRVANHLALELANGNAKADLPQLRSDVVNALVMSPI